MTQVQFASRIMDDIARIEAHLRDNNSGAAGERIAEISEALGALAHNPRLGRPAEDGMRELVIGRDRLGYLALYRYFEKLELVLVIALRSQREDRYNFD